MKSLPLLFIALLFAMTLGSAGAFAEDSDWVECGMFVSPEQRAADSLRMTLKWSPPSRGVPDYPYHLPVAVHLVIPDDTTGMQNPLWMHTEQVDTAMYYLNQGFEDADMAYYLTEGIDYILEDIQDSCYFWCIGPSNAEERLDSLARTNHVDSAINLYCIWTPFFCGAATTPDHPYHAVVLNSWATGGDSSETNCPGNPSTLAHEFGHFFGLYHTHGATFCVECPDGSNCDTCGDLICDTPADPNLLGHVSDAPECEYDNYFPPPAECDETPYDPDPLNLMSYSNKWCRDLFTPGQIDRMHFFLLTDTLLGNELFPPCTDSIAWEEKYGGFGDDEAYAVVQTSDGGFAFAGYADRFGPDGTAAYIAKTDVCGRVSWIKYYGETDDYEAYAIEQTSDGGFIIAGKTPSYQVYLLKTDAYGEIDWSREFGSTSYQSAYSVHQTSDGGYILAGYSGTVINHDFYLAKFDSYGDMSWDNTFGGSTHEFAYSVEETFDGGYIIAGHTQSYGAGGDDFYLVKTTSSGYKSWDQTYGGAGDEIAFDVKQTADSGFILAGYTTSEGAGGKDYYVVKTNSSGTLSWDTTYGYNADDIAYSVETLYGGGYIIAGTGKVRYDFEQDFYILKINSTGGLIWSKTYGGTDNDGARSIIRTDDGGYMAAGYSNTYCFGGSDAYLVKLEETESYICGDANGDENINIFDINYIIDYVYHGGPPPVPLEAADLNCDKVINILDVTYLINFLYKSGPEPCADC